MFFPNPTVDYTFFFCGNWGNVTTSTVKWFIMLYELLGHGSNIFNARCPPKKVSPLWIKIGYSNHSFELHPHRPRVRFHFRCVTNMQAFITSHTLLLCMRVHDTCNRTNHSKECVKKMAREVLSTERCLRRSMIFSN